MYALHVKLEHINPPQAQVNVMLVQQEPQAPWLLLLPTTVRAQALAGKILLEVLVCVLRDITAKIVLHARQIHTALEAKQPFGLHVQTFPSLQPGVTPLMIVCVIWGTLVWMPLYASLAELILTKMYQEHRIVPHAQITHNRRRRVEPQTHVWPTPGTISQVELYQRAQITPTLW